MSHPHDPKILIISRGRSSSCLSSFRVTSAFSLALLARHRALPPWLRLILRIACLVSWNLNSPPHIHSSPWLLAACWIQVPQGVPRVAPASTTSQRPSWNAQQVPRRRTGRRRSSFSASMALVTSSMAMRATATSSRFSVCSTALQTISTTTTNVSTRRRAPSRAESSLLFSSKGRN